MDLVEAAGASERRHPWEEARFAFFRRVLQDASLDAPGANVLDVGAGDGWFARQLAISAPGVNLLCWDSAYDRESLPAAGIARDAIRFTPERPRDAFDVVLLLDVLEHVPDDRAFLAELVAQQLRSGGRLLFSVPAWPSLFSSHDARLCHCRRYAPSACRGVLRHAGLEVERAGGLFHSLLPARAVQLLAERARLSHQQPHAGEWDGSPVLTWMVRRALAWDTSFSRIASAVGWDVPGLSWWALCRKP